MKGQMDNQALKVIGEVKKAVIGKDDCIVKVMTAILAGSPGWGRPPWLWRFPRPWP